MKNSFSLYMEYSVIYPFWIMAFKQKTGNFFPLDFASLKIGLSHVFHLNGASYLTGEVR